MNETNGNAQIGDENEINKNLWPLGILFISLASLLTALGDNLIRLSFTRNAETFAKTGISTPFYKRRLWIMGFFCIFPTSTILNLVAYGLADAVS